MSMDKHTQSCLLCSLLSSLNLVFFNVWISLKMLWFTLANNFIIKLSGLTTVFVCRLECLSFIVQVLCKPNWYMYTCSDNSNLFKLIAKILTYNHDYASYGNRHAVHESSRFCSLYKEYAKTIV